MELRASERLILWALCEIYEHIEVKGWFNANLVKEAILTDNTWAIPWVHQIIFQDQEIEDPQDVKDVLKILSMWTMIERSYNALTQEEKNELEEKANVFGKNVVFRGFDGTNEADYMSIADFLIKELGRFENFAERELNSHSSSDKYFRMLDVYEGILADMNKDNLSVEELALVLNAQTHPDFR